MTVIKRCAALLLLLAPPAFSLQRPAAPTFEVATIKPNTSPQPVLVRYVDCHGTNNSTDATIPIGRCISKGMPLKLVIAYAYDIPAMQVSQIIIGGPAWLDDLYDIEAKAETPVVVAELKLMLQSLLKDRLKLELHREKRAVSTFDLVVAKNGSKLKPAPNDKPCVASPTLGPCHGFMGGRGRGLHGQSVSTADLAVNLTFWADRIVIDKTQLSGLFDVLTTPWVPENAGPNFAAEAGTDPANLPTFFTMLQEQLGLRLESQKELIEVLVIDRAEKPAD